MSRHWRARLARMAAVLALAASTFVVNPSQSVANHDGMCGYFQYDRSSGYNGDPQSGNFFKMGCNNDWWWYRGGSGNGSKDECRKGEGWLPLGWYDQWGHWDNYQGTLIKGQAWWVQNKKCHNGSVTRTELFVHTKYPWDGNYKSNGCIKLSYNDSLNMHHWYHYAGGTWTHGAHTYSGRLWVWD